LRKKIENAYGFVLNKTFKVANPIKKVIINTDCITHINIQKQSFNILKMYDYMQEYTFFKRYIDEINRGLVWADQDFKSYNHFYNPITKKGMYGYEDNALTVCKKYYEMALEHYKNKNYEEAFLYFGASCHLLHDTTIPQHAKIKLFDNHKPFEIFIKRNYHKIKRYKSHDKPILLNTIEEFIDKNAFYALKVDDMYKDVYDINSKNYFISIKTVTMAQRSSAGFMIMFYNEVKEF